MAKNGGKDGLDPQDRIFLVDVSDEEEGGGGRTLSFSRSPTVLLTFVANRFSRISTRQYIERFGIGVMDWRMLVMLTREPGATVTRASNVIGIDKAAVSRCLQRLDQMGLAHPGELEPNGRSRRWRLSLRGRELHDQVLRRALQFQRQLLSGFTDEEIKQLLDMLRRMLTNIAKTDDVENC